MDWNIIIAVLCSGLVLRFGYTLFQIHMQGVNISFKMKYQYELNGTYEQKQRKFKMALTAAWLLVIICSLVVAVTVALLIMGL